MRVRIAVLLILLLSGTLAANQRHFTVVDIANPEYADDNLFAIMENLNQLAQEKQDKNSSADSSNLAYVITELDKKNAEDNAFAIMRNLEDLRLLKVDATTGTRTYSLEDISNPDTSEENTNAINIMFDEAWRDLADKEL